MLKDSSMPMESLHRIHMDPLSGAYPCPYIWELSFGRLIRLPGTAYLPRGEPIPRRESTSQGSPSPTTTSFTTRNCQPCSTLAQRIRVRGYWRKVSTLCQTLSYPSLRTKKATQRRYLETLRVQDWYSQTDVFHRTKQGCFMSCFHILDDGHHTIDTESANLVGQGTVQYSILAHTFL